MTDTERLQAAIAQVRPLFGRRSRLALAPHPEAQANAPPGYESSGQPRSVVLPGVVPWATSPRTSAEDAARAMLDPLSYMARVGYDLGPSQTRFSGYPATDLAPYKIAGAQQEAAAGWPLRWEEMIEQVLSRDAHLGGIAQQRVDDVVKGSWRLVR